MITDPIELDETEIPFPDAAVEKRAKDDNASPDGENDNEYGAMPSVAADAHKSTHAAHVKSHAAFDSGKTDDHSDADAAHALAVQSHTTAACHFAEKRVGVHHSSRDVAGGDVEVGAVIPALRWQRLVGAVGLRT